MILFRRRKSKKDKWADHRQAIQNAQEHLTYMNQFGLTVAAALSYFPDDMLLDLHFHQNYPNHPYQRIHKYEVASCLPSTLYLAKVRTIQVDSDYIGPDPNRPIAIFEIPQNVENNYLRSSL